MHTRFWVGFCLIACSFLALAAGPGAVRKQVEMSMLVTGTIDIQLDGSVGAHAIDQADALPQSVIELLGSAVPAWRFEPVLIEGKPVKARAKMRLRMVAKKQDDGNYLVGIRSASFGEEGGIPGETVTRDKLPPPQYPREAYMSGMSGTVYLIVRVGRQGVVEDVVAEQVNMTVVGSEQQMKRGRDLLSRAAMQKTKAWVFTPPTKGDEADAPFWSVRVPVDFRFANQTQAKYGQWEAYVPGPQQRPSWIRDADALGSPDAMVAGGVYQIGKGPRLLTPLGQG